MMIISALINSAYCTVFLGIQYFILQYFLRNYNRLKDNRHFMTLCLYSLMAFNLLFIIFVPIVFFEQLFDPFGVQNYPMFRFFLLSGFGTLIVLFSVINWKSGRE